MNPSQAYGQLARAFHWTIAGLLLLQIPLAFYMVDQPLGPDKFSNYATHKSLGLLLFTATALRLAWRLTHPAPPLPHGIARWQRVVARVNHPKNEWMFDESWGVDVAVSTPRMLSALVEEAVSVGDLVRLFTFRQGDANLVEITLSTDSPVVNQRVGDQTWPPDTALVAIVRGPRVIAPSADDPIEAGDELLFVAAPDQEPELQRLLGHL